MNDLRVKEAQQLFWQIETLRSLQVPQKTIAAHLSRMARLHEERAKELLSRRDVDGWPDLFAAITAWGEAGSEPSARHLIRFGEHAAASFDGREHLLSELEHLEDWLKGLQVVPALEDFARRLPRFDREAA
ncbi:hypothetical protein [Sorangium cellulosum]|uniref:Uncharacterized protein n=1 Tax=Sorangium cellulosum So0157-2 TaxID=1254432 RepID=S4Y8Q6_SORCE|nr:hypothetical protein [Sorangium cellulosum]AGP41264.1 hypothetical protein SCE1572_46305 [Sorangium cellulosum So0157-2]